MTKASKSGNLYLVEQYSPGATVDQLASWAARVRDTAVAIGNEGRAVNYLRSTIVPADEALLCVFEAGSEELVREVYARAGVPFERLSAVLADESEWLYSEPSSGAGGAPEAAQQSTERKMP
jgi:Nickel responsive protein SCO4226-like